MDSIIQLSKHTIVYGVGGVLNRFLGFIFLPLFTAYLSPEEYGILSILNIISIVTISIFSLGLGASIGPSYFDGGQKERKDSTIWTAFTLLTWFVSPLIFFPRIFANAISNIAFGSTIFSDYVVITIITIILSILAIPHNLSIQFEKRANLFVLISLLSSIISLTVSLLAIVAFSLGVKGYICGILCGVLTNLMLSLLFSIKDRSYKFNKSIAMQIVRVSIPMIPSTVFMLIMQHGNRYIIQNILGLDLLGIYTIGFNIGFIMNLFVSAFMNAWYPFFMTYINNQAEGARIFSIIATLYVQLFGFITCIFYLFSWSVISIMTDSAFHEAYQIVGLSATSQFLVGIFAILLPGFYYQRQFLSITLSQFFSAITSVILSLLFISRWGILGAAISMSLSYLLLVVILYFTSLHSKHEKVKYRWIKIVPILVLFVTFSLYSYIFPYLSTSFLLLSLLIMVTSMIIIIYCTLDNDIRNYLEIIVKTMLHKKGMI
jgi:O-antigen/teichoic acid export membrane protein